MVASPQSEPGDFQEPQTGEAYRLSGYAAYASGDYPAARADFQQALAINPRDVEALYALGLVCKVQGLVEESVNAFQQSLELIQSGVVENKIRAEMLSRLAKGHLNIMTIGDWNLEKEIWKRNE